MAEEKTVEQAEPTDETEPTPEQPLSKAEANKILKLGEQMDLIKIDEGAVPATMKDQVALAHYAWSSGLLPKSITSSQQAWMVMQRGGELGFPALTAFEFLYVVGGQVRLRPTGAKAKALESGLLLDFKEETVGVDDAMKAVVTIRRKGIPTPIVTEFSVQDAKTAGLWGPSKDNWRKYPKRMLLARARGFAYGDVFADIIGGLPVREVYDLEPGEAIGGVSTVGRKAAEPRQAPSTPDALFGDPDAPPFESHAEADKAISEAEEKE